MSALSAPAFDANTITYAIYGPGIISCPNAFPADYIENIRHEVEEIFFSALSRPGALVPRGPNRYYMDLPHPEKISGDFFRRILMHPFYRSTCETILGPDYKANEFGFDIVGPQSANQPFHRDFVSPPQTLREGRIISLAFNIAMVDITLHNGPLEFVPGTQFDEPEGYVDGILPPKSMYPEYLKKAYRKPLVTAGTMTARSQLAIHRGTANKSDTWRLVMVVASDGPEGTNAERHDLQVTEEYHRTLPEELLRHLHYRKVKVLEDIIQVHQMSPGMREAMS